MLNNNPDPFANEETFDEAEERPLSGCSSNIDKDDIQRVTDAMTEK